MDDPIIEYERFEDTPFAGELRETGYTIEGERPVFIRREEGFEASVLQMHDGDWLVYCPTEEDESTHEVADLDGVEDFIRSRM